MSNAFVVSPIENGCPLPTRPMSAPTGIVGIGRLVGVAGAQRAGWARDIVAVGAQANLARRLEPQVLPAAAR